ncbi:related to ubiquitin C-terminal hydrolase [Ramularia collo-cygni]|uniref:ubiquitinyl hydrolase 1 n=1 Tax=Ramularia collo-cygni TaxID=112498 RepID=A0A2D3VJI3_9PEZI|nr:related to ubiquitin C-terminal hydrolase [Ramularia collo-cygni]CZT23469.1 related to ubiquitin C-terminal hydrolase [Ramularia collo-cygni]
MDRRIQLENHTTWGGIVLYGAIILYGFYWVLGRFDIAILPPQELLFNTVVYCIPTPILLGSARRQELKENGMLSQRHAAKSEAFRRLLGLGGNALLQGGESVGIGKVIRRASMGTKTTVMPISDAPAGLGNWDNSCYQNSVLQALASLESLRTWLSMSEPPQEGNAFTTNAALQEMVRKLKDPGNNGSHIWTTAKLKSMSSWQQQDAQEYFSKVMDELDKEAAKAANLAKKKAGLETLVKNVEDEQPVCDGDGVKPSTSRNPLEGLTAQRISCTQCGFSEGYSMNPFNCLTVPLGNMSAYDIEDCLHEYTKREDIEGVECRSCTLIQTKNKLSQMLPSQAEGSTTSPTISLPPELRLQIEERLQIVQQALDNDDFSDKMVKQDCQISSKAMVSTTKTREAVIGRAPQSLVVHVNRSVFDEMTGVQRKNYAIVRYPFILDLRPWMLDIGDTPTQYSLKAVVTHYGRHENGHYICYKRHPRREADNEDDDTQKERWWRLSDEDVSPVSDQDVLDQAGVFMLFYEKLDEQISPIATEEWTDAVPVAQPEEEAVEMEATNTVTAEVSTELPRAEEEAVEETVTSVSSVEEARSKAPRPQPLLKTASPKFVRPDMGMNRPLMSV